MNDAMSDDPAGPPRGGVGALARRLRRAWLRAPTTISGTWRSPAAYDSMIYASARGPLLLTVHGGPDAETIRAAMDDTLIGRRLAFTLDPGRAAHPEFRVVLAFDPPTDLAPEGLCGSPPPPPTPDPERIRVTASFCAKGECLAAADGRVGARDPADPPFRRMMGQLVRTLFGDPPTGES
jgi:hypothetical protein